MNKKWKIIGIAICLSVILLMNFSLDQRNVSALTMHKMEDLTVGIHDQRIRDSVHVVFKGYEGCHVGEKTYDAGSGWKFFTYRLWVSNKGKEKQVFCPSPLYDEDNMTYNSFYPDEWYGTKVFFEDSPCICIDRGYDPYIHPGETYIRSVIYKIPITDDPKLQYVDGSTYYFQEQRWEDT